MKKILWAALMLVSSNVWAFESADNGYIYEPNVVCGTGTYEGPLAVHIAAVNMDADEVWYSFTAKDSISLMTDHETIKGCHVWVWVKKDSRLTACVLKYGRIGCVATHDYEITIPLQSDFGCKELRSPYYEMGWDSPEEKATWQYSGVAKHDSATWKLQYMSTNPNAFPYTVFDLDNRFSLIMEPSLGDQDEHAISPAIEIADSSFVEFWEIYSVRSMRSCDVYLIVHDETAQKQDTLWDAYSYYSECPGCQNTSWEHIWYSLHDYAGHTCRFEFVYVNRHAPYGGHNITIDGFAVCSGKSSYENGEPLVKSCGAQIHFEQMSEGTADSYEWHFEGGMPEVSTEANPVVEYNVPGTYAVTLTTRRGKEVKSCTKKNFIQINKEEVTGLAEVETLVSKASSLRLEGNRIVLCRDGKRYDLSGKRIK